MNLSLDGHLLNVSGAAKPVDVCVRTCVCFKKRIRERDPQTEEYSTVTATITIRLFLLFDMECETMHE